MCSRNLFSTHATVHTYTCVIMLFIYWILNVRQMVRQLETCNLCKMNLQNDRRIDRPVNGWSKTKQSGSICRRYLQKIVNFIHRLKFEFTWNNTYLLVLYICHFSIIVWPFSCLLPSIPSHRCLAGSTLFGLQVLFGFH